MDRPAIRRAVWVGEADAVTMEIIRRMEKRGCETDVLLTEADCDQPLGVRVRRTVERYGEAHASVDMVVLALRAPMEEATGDILADLDEEALLAFYRMEALLPIEALSRLVPLLEKGEVRRVCAVLRKDDSHALCRDTGRYGTHMAGAALRLALREAFNALHPKGYTFRLYAAEGRTLTADDTYAAEYFLRDRSWEEEDPPHSDENRFVMRDANGLEAPW